MKLAYLFLSMTLWLNGSMAAVHAQAKPGDAQTAQSATIKASGVDDLLKAMNSGKQDHMMQELMLALILAKGAAQTEADGTLVWHLSIAPNGGVLINGKTLKDLSPVAGLRLK